MNTCVDYLYRSTVSSGVNALAASITEDYIRPWRPNLNDTQLAYVSKATALVTGLLAFAFVFIAEQMGSIFSAAVTLLGILGGPTLGIFICGQFFPWANTAVSRYHLELDAYSETKTYVLLLNCSCLRVQWGE